VFSRILFVRWCCKKIGGYWKGEVGHKVWVKKRKIGKKIPVPTPVPDVLYNNSIYTYLINYIYTQDYEVYLLHDTRLRRIGKNRYDEFRLMIDEMLNDYFALAAKTKCKVSPMAMFTLYDYQNASKHRRSIVIITLDETDFTCVSVNPKPYFDYYFGGYKR